MSNFLTKETHHKLSVCYLSPLVLVLVFTTLFFNLGSAKIFLNISTFPICMIETKHSLLFPSS